MLLGGDTVTSASVSVGVTSSPELDSGLSGDGAVGEVGVGSIPGGICTFAGALEGTSAFPVDLDNGGRDSIIDSGFSVMNGLNFLRCWWLRRVNLPEPSSFITY